ncbi:MAG TPA: DUF1015 domain-containing protein [Firmicutes bacterium]|uniref:DUF1015 domain-containing protein n=1 Tax=Capillibacterium thermochitinicola TaxID=2699427 RepID=A0A8J6HZY7_9FIRM|nr:DUF1015 domain-containing protein [Capillibacterium thermochitinicola]HHW11723.1 DUF1015 domain-containing protein [Bacillota bacterium]
MLNPADLGIQIPTVLVPAAHIDPTKWAVIACDQYTSNPEYWAEVRRQIGDSPSTFDLILPEVYLDDPEVDTKIQQINARMRTYLAEKILVPLEPGLILIDRRTAHVPSRKGLLLAVDLEKYDYRPGTKSLIRPTEETIADRLPPRIKIREGALLEVPHIMLLLDDPEQTVIEPLFAHTSDLPLLYDFDLMMNGGHLTGYHLTDPVLLNRTFQSLTRLITPEFTAARYGPDEAPLLFAVGDGNHSLATAKAIWEKLKQQITDPATLQDHPARFCLVEVVNLYDEGLIFHPIHRLLFNIDADQFFGELQSHLPCRITTDRPEGPDNPETQYFHFCTATTTGMVILEQPGSVLTVGTLQPFLDAYLRRHPECRIDYIHGDETIKTLGRQPGNLGLILPPLNKHDLFKTVIRDGALPRKTFSMGEADEKRFYFEARKIRRD